MSLQNKTTNLDNSQICQAFSTQRNMENSVYLNMT